MNFEEGYIYHIYNQGNNRRQIFFSRDNYLFFLEKMKAHIVPYADILAWCLMPNHFHLMVYLNRLSQNFNQDFTSRDIQSGRDLESHPDLKSQAGDPSSIKEGTYSQGATQSRTLTFNNSIGIMLASYTRAINKQQGWSGSLFRKETKSECINCPSGITPSFIMQDGITKVTHDIPEKQYPTVCFNYIHQNPVNAKLVSQVTDWEFSSALDYTGLRKGKLVNKKRAEEYISLSTSWGATQSRTPT